MIAQPGNVDKRPQSMLSFFLFSWFSFFCGCFALKFFFHSVYALTLCQWLRESGTESLAHTIVWKTKWRFTWRFLPFLISLYKIIASEKTLSFDEEGFQWFRGELNCVKCIYSKEQLELRTRKVGPSVNSIALISKIFKLKCDHKLPPVHLVQSE